MKRKCSAVTYFHLQTTITASTASRRPLHAKNSLEQLFSMRDKLNFHSFTRNNEKVEKFSGTAPDHRTSQLMTVRSSFILACREWIMMSTKLSNNIKIKTSGTAIRFLGRLMGTESTDAVDEEDVEEEQAPTRERKA